LREQGSAEPTLGTPRARACAIVRLALQAACGLMLGVPLAAQVPDTVSVQATILDGETRGPVVGAVVRHMGTGRVTVTDSAGVFRMVLPQRAAYPLTIEQLGFTSRDTFLPDSARATGVILLTPRPVELEGLTVQVRGQLAERRRFAGTDSRVLETVDLFDLGISGDQVLRNAIPMSKLCIMDTGELCLLGKRGVPSPIAVCLDEQPAYGGAGDLSRYEPWEIHSVEIYGRGGMVRVYTRDFITRLLREGRRLRPLALGC